MKQEEFSIEDLALRSGLSIRTVRYYMQQGLVPGPDTAGKNASYSRRHLDHLCMIQRLKRLHLPLKEIQHLIANMSTEDMQNLLTNMSTKNMQQLLTNQDKNLKKKETEHYKGELSSPMDYIEGLARRQERVKHIANQPSYYGQRNANMTQEVRPERWSKIRLAKGIELQIREQESRALRKEIDQLIQAAQHIFGKGK